MPVGVRFGHPCYGQFRWLRADLSANLRRMGSSGAVWSLYRPLVSVSRATGGALRA
jgi:hypothetical protein